MNYLPKITIVTPNFNGSAYLEETIKSVIRQKYPNLEYIIIDGGSSDTSVDIIKKYEEYITYWVSEPDGGMYEAIQKGFENSSGEIMSWLNSDDMYHPNSFFTIAEIFMNHKEVHWLTGYNTHYDENNRTVALKEAYPHTKYDMFLEREKFIQQESTFWTRSLWEIAGAKVDINLKYAGDFELWIRFFRYAKLHRVSALIGGFRVRSGQLSQLNMKQYVKESNQVLEQERQLLSFYDICAINDIYLLRKELNITTDQFSQNNILKKLQLLLDCPSTIKFDHKNKLFKGDHKMKNQSIEKIMQKRRNNLNDFLGYIKTEHKFYPEVIIDVGVAHGTYELYENFPKSQILLIEPIEEFNSHLEKIKNKYDSVSIFNCAVGSNEGKMTINVHDDLMGSSLYNEAEGEDTDGIKREIDIKTLDQLCSKYIGGTQKALLKIDVQGAELDVMNGAKKLLENIEIIVLEVSLHKFFINGPELYDVMNYMNKIGFVVYDIFGFLNRPIDGALAQVDIAFVKKDSIFRQSNFFATKEQREILKNINSNLCVNQKNNDESMIAFQKQFNTMYEKIESIKMTNAKYVIYGYGMIGKTIYALIPENIIAFVDRSCDLISNKIISGNIYSPNNLSNIEYDYIIISVLGREEEIEQYLIEELGVEKRKIVKFVI